jgi:hypothetical protein
MTDSHRRDQVLLLMGRFNSLGRLLPSEDDVRDDADIRATARVILLEMKHVRAQIDALIDAENSSETDRNCPSAGRSSHRDAYLRRGMRSSTLTYRFQNGFNYWEKHIA